MSNEEKIAKAKLYALEWKKCGDHIWDHTMNVYIDGLAACLNERDEWRNEAKRLLSRVLNAQVFDTGFLIIKQGSMLMDEIEKCLNENK